MSSVNLLVLTISLGFGLLASTAAFLITYKEWMHHYTDKKEPTKHGLKVAFVTFLFFVALSILASVIISQFILNQ